MVERAAGVVALTVLAFAVACTGDGDTDVAPGDDEPGTLPLGTPCGDDGACASGVCVGWCSERCATDEECAGDPASPPNRCAEDTRGVRWCFAGCTEAEDCAGITPDDGGAALACVETAGGGICSR